MSNDAACKENLTTGTVRRSSGNRVQKHQQTGADNGNADLIANSSECARWYNKNITFNNENLFGGDIITSDSEISSDSGSSSGCGSSCGGDWWNKQTNK